MNRIWAKFRTLHRGPLYFSVLLFLFGVVIWYADHRVRSNFRRTANWSQIYGKLTFAEYDVFYDTDGISHESIDVEYTYEVDGTTYTNDLVSYATPTNVRKYQDIFNHGQIVNVKYDPENPADSVLQDGIPPSRNGTIAWVGLAFVGAIYFFIDSFEKGDTDFDSLLE